MAPDLGGAEEPPGQRTTLAHLLGEMPEQVRVDTPFPVRFGLSRRPIAPTPGAEHHAGRLGPRDAVGHPGAERERHAVTRTGVRVRRRPVEATDAARRENRRGAGDDLDATAQ